MKTKIFALIFVSTLFLTVGCQESNPVGNPNTNPNTEEWLVPKNLVRDGGPGKDGIPSIDNPRFSNVDDIDFLGNDDLVVLVEVDGDVRGYPHPILDWHEIANDRPGLKPLAITYCPLTGTAIGWERRINNVETTFGVSGLLYNTNLLPYDRETNSTWSQLRQDCINGELISQKAVQYPVTEIEWGLLKETMPEIMILNTDTGASRDYTRYPYGDYKINNNKLFFPITEEDNTLPQKERVLSLINGNNAKAYRFSSFPKNGGVIEDDFTGDNFVIVGNESLNYIVAFHNPGGLSFTYVEDAFPVVFKDGAGNNYDIFGRSDSSADLVEANACIGFWFSFPAFFDNVDVYE